MALVEKKPSTEDVPEGFPDQDIERARKPREKELKRVEGKFGVFSEIAERIHLAGAVLSAS